jgi:hypothetical protein
MIEVGRRKIARVDRCLVFRFWIMDMRSPLPRIHHRPLANRLKILSCRKCDFEAVPSSRYVQSIRSAFIRKFSGTNWYSGCESADNR